MAEHGLQVGTPELVSVGSIAFGPDDVLFVADTTRATVLAIDVADESADAEAGTSNAFDLDDLGAKLAAFLGCADDDVAVRDLAVHPRTGNVYLSVMRGRGDEAIPVLVRIDRRNAELSELSLTDVAFSELEITSAPAHDDERTDVQLGHGPDAEKFEFNGISIFLTRPHIRSATVTDMAYVDGELIVAGMSNEEFSSTLRRIPFPFTGEHADTQLEIFHVSHGMWETASPIRTFVPYQNGASILASYTCTPLVQFTLDAIKPNTIAKGHTVAEFGFGNQPLDMVSFHKDGEEYLLVAHSRHPLTKVACRDIDVQPALTEPHEPEGVPRDELDVPGVVKLASLDDAHVLTLQRDDAGGRHLRSLKTASL
ncbi:MAG: hypothetical protein ABW033_08725 [Acidimicrobiia bacterium]